MSPDNLLNSTCHNWIQVAARNEWILNEVKMNDSTDCWTPIAKGSLSLGFKVYFVRLSTAKSDTKDRWIQGLVLWKDERDWQTFGQAHQEKKRRPK